MNKLDGELNYWKELVNDLTRMCSSEAEKHDVLLRICHERTFERYKHDLYLNDDSFVEKRILDLACGPHCGIIGFQGAEKYGVDHLIDEYRKIGYPLDEHGVEYCNAKSEKLPYPNDFFDAVLCVNALDHVDDVSDSLREISRVLKPNGRFLAQINLHKTPSLCEPNCLTHEFLARELDKNEFHIGNIKYQLSIDDEDRYFYESCKGKMKVSWEEWEADLSISYASVRSGNWLNN